MSCNHKKLSQSMESPSRLTTFRLREDLAGQVRELIFRKYGTLYGSIQSELNRAVENHIPLLLKEIEVARKSEEEAHNG